MSIFNEYDLSAAADKSIKHFTDARTSEADNDKSEPRAKLTNGLDRGGDDVNGKPRQQGGEAPRIFADNQPTEERAKSFSLPGEYESPVMKQRRRTALALPSPEQLHDLEYRVTRANRFGALPDGATALAQAARLAISQAREAYVAAQDTQTPRLARSVTDKDQAVLMVAKATAAVGALEALLAEAPVRQAHFEAVVGDLDEQRDAALAALKEARKAYAALRSTIQSANALALEQDRWDKAWHHGLLEERHLNEPLEHMANAIGWLEGDDDSANGRFLTEEYEGIPPHALARLERSANRSAPGSFAKQVFQRAKTLAPNDYDAQQAVQTKSLLVLLNSNSWAEVARKAEKAGVGESSSRPGSGIVVHTI